MLTDPLRVLLVAPPMDFMRELYGFSGGRTYRNQPPLGIGYIASTLRCAGIDVAILDAAAHGWSVVQAARRVAGWEPDVVGITAISLEAAAAFALVRAIKARLPVPIVVGGAHVNTNWRTVVDECPEVDAFVAGDGERAMLDICRAVIAGAPLDAIPGVRARRGDRSFSDLVERDLVDDLDELPPPAYDLYPHAMYRPLPHRQKRLPSTAMITSRGCSYAECTYCEMSSLVRKVYRRHSPARVVDEIRQLKLITGARDLYFQDDIFVTDEDWVEELCDRLIAADLDLMWTCESRFVPRPLLRRMREAGCWRIYYGFEAGDQELLDRIKKGFTLDEARTAARDAREAGLEVMGFFMLGLPGETPAMGDQTICFACSLDLDHVAFSLTVPHPTTELYRICEQQGVVLEDHNYHTKRASYLPAGYDSAEQLQALQAEAYRRFYLRPAYMARSLGRIRSLADVAYFGRGAAALLGYLDS
jgi:anaerobic magnesium-protoporphyrin IX monomethyl ester cyclase